MLSNKENEEEIIIDYLSGNISPEHETEFDAWLKENQKRNILFKNISRTIGRIRFSEAWDRKIDEDKACKQVLQKVRKHQTSRKIWWYSAASLIILIGSLWLHYQMEPQIQPAPLAVVPTSNKHAPILTLHDGQIIQLGDSNNTNDNIKKQTYIQRHDSNTLEYLPTDSSINTETTYNTLTIPTECEFNLILSDGSRVWLNAGSELRYPTHFNEKTRNVYLKGEAFFEVAHDTDHPFIVHTQEMQLKVLGTSFNIQAYPDDSQVITTLVSGKIIQYFSKISDETILTPSWQSIYDVKTGKKTVQQADIEAVLAWKNGKFIARDECLEDILKRLGRWYDFQVVYTNPELKHLRFHIHCKRYDNIMDLLKQVEETYGIRFNYNKGIIYVSQ